MRHALLVVALLLAGCGEREREPLVVLAAASLAEALESLEVDYEQDHPDLDLQLSFAGSQVLAAQVRDGAPADVLVTADTDTLAALGPLVGPPTTVARNALAIITAPGNPRAITTLADLAEAGTTVVLAGPSVPVGRAARAALAEAGVVLEPVSDEPDVRAVVSRVRLGEADAGIAYATDLRDPGVEGTVLASTSTTYPAAVVAASERTEQAAAFVAFLASPTGREALGDAGLLPPP